MNLVIYARISDKKQSENSIDAQLRVSREWAQANGHTVTAEYVDLAKSAKNSDSYMTGEERSEFLGLVVDQIVVDGENRLVEVKTKNGFKFEVNK
jgi:DNA invertase Pin-like site-specific DNA recombinase